MKTKYIVTIGMKSGDVIELKVAHFEVTRLETGALGALKWEGLVGKQLLYVDLEQVASVESRRAKWYE